MRIPDNEHSHSFSWALEKMKDGHRVDRYGWNGKGMWICQSNGNLSVPAEFLWNHHTKNFANEHGGFAQVLPYFIMKTADDKILMGWLASQTDLMAHDWAIVPEKR